jgi:hypothetical protein
MLEACHAVAYSKSCYVMICDDIVTSRVAAMQHGVVWVGGRGAYAPSFMPIGMFAVNYKLCCSCLSM